ncbi:hypothetical protein PMAYCL1PPCAC_09312, partial [Pristionchus mayeri]
EMKSLISIGMAAGVSLNKLSNTKKVAGALFGYTKFVLNNGLIRGISGLIGTILQKVNHIVDKGIEMVRRNTPM